jgi:hypothetical protein
MWLTFAIFMQMNYIDYIIVGAGLAGTCLTWKLRQLGRTVCQISDPVLPAASSVAAGMYNPLVFKRLTRSWKVDELLPVMNDFYTRVEAFSDKKFMYQKKIVKVLTADEYCIWNSRMDSGAFDDYIVSVSQKAPMGGLKEFYAYGLIKNSGYLDIKRFTEAVYNQGGNTYDLVKERFKYNDIGLGKGNISWKNYTASRIVFCEGAYAINNPFFGNIPYKLTRGDILEVRIENFQDEYILNKQVFLLPLGNSRYLCGSTYNWSDLDFRPQPGDKEFLIEKLRSILTVPFQVTGHRTGVRPTVSDRRPVLGVHPEHPQLCYFNGLGTKGVMLGPYFADELISYMEDGHSLTSEVAITRFF